MEYVIVYTNDRMVQGHHVYCLVSRVNIFYKGRFKGKHLPLLCRFIMMNLSPSLLGSLVMNVIHVRNCWNK